MVSAHIDAAVVANELLLPVCRFFRTQLLDANLDSIFRKDDVLLLHLLLATVCQLIGPEVDLDMVSLTCATTEIT